MYKIRIVLASIIFLLSIIGFFGVFYEVKIFDIQFTPLLQKLFIDFSITAAVIMFSLVLLTLLFGRIYCSIICPLGFLQELICFISKEDNENQKNLPIKYFIAAISFGILIGGSAIILKFLDSYTIFASLLSLSVIGISFFIVIAILTFFKKRYFCTNICPVGTILGLISKVSLLKVHIDKDNCLSCGMCERNCPSGCIESSEGTVDNEMCIKCFKCFENCSREAIHYGIKPKSEVKFNIKRREFITASAAILLFAGAAKAGFELAGKTVKQIKDFILPPGAENPQRLKNSCLNCNLCVEACPNKIIKKADKNCSYVYIDYDEGKKYCKFDCNECSIVCPSGAIKKISVEEKQKTKIATAVINTEKCSECYICNYKCPVGAISQNEKRKSVVDASKCIGCGICKTACTYDAVEVFAVKEQKVL